MAEQNNFKLCSFVLFMTLYWVAKCVSLLNYVWNDLYKCETTCQTDASVNSLLMCSISRNKNIL